MLVACQVRSQKRQAMKLSLAIVIVIISWAVLPAAASAESEMHVPGISAQPEHPSTAKIYFVRGKVHQVNARTGTVYITHDPRAAPLAKDGLAQHKQKISGA